MKKLLLFSLVIVLVLVSTLPAAPVSAMSEKCANVVNLKGTLRFALAGRVRAVDTLNRTVTVEILAGNRIAKKCLGEYIVLDTTANTRFLYSGGAKSSIANLSWGDPVSANGKVDKLTGEWVARRISEGASLLNK